MSAAEPTARFSGRSSAYARARPGYPDETLDVLAAADAFRRGMRIADIGAGTGIFTRLLLDGGAHVFAVEPNDEMRAALAKDLGEAPGLTLVNGRAEATHLADGAVDVVVAAQAFHWFDAPKFGAEARRILRPGGSIALVWNDRDTTTSPFAAAFEALLVAHCPRYRDLQGKSDTPEKFDALFGAGRWTRSTIDNAQSLDREGLVDRVVSASYAPMPGAAGHSEIVAALEALFDTHAARGIVTFTYRTVVVAGAPGTG